jgi:hypothetical protein
MMPSGSGTIPPSWTNTLTRPVAARSAHTLPWSTNYGWTLAFDRFDDLGVGGMYRCAHLLADVLLPGQEGIDAGVDLRVERRVGLVDRRRFPWRRSNVRMVVTTATIALLGVARGT